MVVPATDALEIIRSRSRGYVGAVKKAYKDLKADELISKEPPKKRDLVKAIILSRIIRPQAKLATTRTWHGTTLAEALKIEEANEDELYSVMGWLAERQPEIEKN